MAEKFEDSYPFPPVSSFRQPRYSKQEDDSEEMSITSSVESEMARRRSKVFGSVTKIIIALILTVAFAVFLMKAKPTSDNVPYSVMTTEDYFSIYPGHSECGVRSQSLYTPPSHNTRTLKHEVFCPTRNLLLEALSGGGRHGFDAPYQSIGCHYRWYTTTDICMILERFDAIVFIGDDMLKHIYAAFNILLREDIALGGLKSWELTGAEKETCRCDAQFTSAKCSEKMVMESEIVAEHEKQRGEDRSPCRCNRAPHVFLPVSGSPASDELHDRFTNLLKGNPDSYKPIPVIHTLGLSTSLSWPDATASMDEWVSMADASGRSVPFLWVGPNAAGHLKPPAQIMAQGNNALWHYTVEMAKEARSRDLDALGMYNLTLQASSWDGSSYGLRVGLVQAMMVINWLARVEST